jgi:hypothetical protein
MKERRGTMRGVFAIAMTVVLSCAGAAGALHQMGTGGHSGDSDKDRPDKTGKVSGVVTDRGGNPVARALIMLKEAEDSEETLAEAISDHDGSFLMEDVEEGVYVVVVRKMGFETLVQKEVPVLAGREIQLRLVLHPSP